MILVLLRSRALGAMMVHVNRQGRVHRFWCKRRATSAQGTVSRELWGRRLLLLLLVLLLLLLLLLLLVLLFIPLLVWFFLLPLLLAGQARAVRGSPLVFTCRHGH
jgi:hypothetical protein